jgi:hypothetical protein
MAAAALAQAVGDATNYARTALLFVEPYSATLAVVNTADGSVSEAHRRLLSDDEDRAVTELVQMVSGIESLETVPDGIFVVGSGVDVPMIKPALEAATSLQLSVPHEPEMALAQGAALASAHAPLFASSTVALAYAQDPGTGQVDPLAFAGQCAGYLPEHRSAAELSPDAPTARLNVAYSAVPDEDADAQTTIGLDERAQRRKSVLLVGSTLAVIFISAVVALEIALAISIRPTVALRPSPNANIVAPARPAPVAPPRAAVPAPRVSAPRPLAVPHPLAPPVGAAPLPIVPPPVFVPLPRGPVGPPRLPGVPRGPGPRGPFGGGPFGGGHGPFRGGPFGGGHGPFGGWGHGPFGGGGHMPFGGGHGFGGFGGGHGFGGFGHR